MNIEERVEIAILTKYYGALLTDRQRDILDLYVDNNLSLAEVSTELGISRQAVKDALDTAFATLKQMEQKLNFVSRDQKIKNILKEKASQINEMTRLEIISILED